MANSEITTGPKVWMRTYEYAIIHIPDGTPDERADTVISFLEMLKFNAVKLRSQWNSISVNDPFMQEQMEELIKDAVLSLDEQGYYGMIEIETGKFSIYKRKQAT